MNKKADTLSAGLIGLVIFIFILWFFVKDDNTSAASNSATAAQTTTQATENSPSSEAAASAVYAALIQFQPEDIVKPTTKMPIACLDKESLNEMIQHYVNNETTKAKGYINTTDNPSAPCIILKSNIKYKVISAEYPNPNAPDAGYIEIVPKSTVAAQSGFWTVSTGFERIN
ncbi:hypothetical protein [Acinetobacter sp. ANC 4641]|uniref:hypothetical protein n=1 Tax=Acinetobacter sp. ANC 4641 TaxID=2529847 RepID=UPI00103A6AA7|nr:hypothetical protein [Acinetobacter sp. ANC 4641]TCB11434.1 hypothetical protein E0H78_07315 [Acinetobacter sp. ANC 4641]